MSASSFARKTGRQDNSRDRDHRSQMSMSMGDSEGDAAGKLFIGGVSWQTTEVQFLICFSLFIFRISLPYCRPVSVNISGNMVS